MLLGMNRIDRKERREKINHELTRMDTNKRTNVDSAEAATSSREGGNEFVRIRDNSWQKSACSPQGVPRTANSAVKKEAVVNRPLAYSFRM